MTLCGIWVVDVIVLTDIKLTIWIHNTTNSVLFFPSVTSLGQQWGDKLVLWLEYLKQKGKLLAGKTYKTRQ